jgi:hypothetical protein
MSTATLPFPVARPVALPIRHPIADSIYRRYFTAAIVLILTAGATWGAWLLWQIGFAGEFTGVSLHHVNAHGHAQIYGWVGLFVMGFAYQMFPKMWRSHLVKPRLAVLAFGLMVAGIVIRTIGMTAHGLGAWAIPAAMTGGALELAAIGVFVGQMIATFRNARATLTPSIGFMLMAMLWLVAQCGLDVWHTWTTMTAATPEALVWYVATYQAPLRDLQVHGLAMFMIFGVSLRILPAFLRLPAVPHRRAWWALGVLTLAVLCEVAIFLVYRFSGKHAIAALLMLPWLLLAIGAWMVAAPWKLWRRPPVVDPVSKFVRIAYGWLGVSLAMLLLMPVYQSISGIAFSHAYYGAIRHAITVGFISMMIVGVSAKIVPALAGLDARRLPALWGPFLLLNTGCFLRVSLQTLTDWHHGFFTVVGVSGLLEVAGLTWWAVYMLQTMSRGKARRERMLAEASIT